MDFQYLNVDNICVRYIDTGSNGNPVLLIHGLGGSIESWINNIHTISRTQLRVIALDLPGFGFSDKPKINYTPNFYSVFIAKFLSKLETCTNISIIGCSLGGHIAAEVALNHPNFISKLILISPAGVPPFSFKGTPALHKYISVLKCKSIQEVKETLLSTGDAPVDDTFVQIFYDKLSMPGAKEAFKSALRGSTYAPRLSRRLRTINAHT